MERYSLKQEQLTRAYTTEETTPYFTAARHFQQSLKEGTVLKSFSPFIDEMLTSLILFRSCVVSLAIVNSEVYQLHQVHKTLMKVNSPQP